MISIAVCDDNKITAQEISKKVKECCPVEAEVSVFYHIKDILYAVHTQNNLYDIIFMDIEFDISSGIEASKQINAWHPDCQIIYITNYMNYFTSVYETSHIYCILKKDMDIYLSAALKKALRQIERIKQFYLIIQSKQQHIRIPQNKILYLERIMRTTNIHTTDGIYQTSEKMDSLLERLCPWFCLSHRSYVVNGRHIMNLDRHHAILSNNDSVPVSRTYYQGLKQTFARCIGTDEIYFTKKDIKENF